MSHNRLRFKSQLEFPGGRVIKLASTVLRRDAKKVTVAAAAAAAVTQALAEGTGGTAQSQVGGGGASGSVRNTQTGAGRAVLP